MENFSCQKLQVLGLRYLVCSILYWLFSKYGTRVNISHAPVVTLFYLDLYNV